MESVVSEKLPIEQNTELQTVGESASFPVVKAEVSGLLDLSRWGFCARSERDPHLIIFENDRLWNVNKIGSVLTFPDGKVECKAEMISGKEENFFWSPEETSRGADSKALLLLIQCISVFPDRMFFLTDSNFPRRSDEDFLSFQLIMALKERSSRSCAKRAPSY